jgi:hypothetical protein
MKKIKSLAITITLLIAALILFSACRHDGGNKMCKHACCKEENSKTATAKDCCKDRDCKEKCEKKGAKENCCSERKNGKESKAMYHCPMCPGVTSDKPGKCPECGMDLEKKE